MFVAMKKMRAHGPDGQPVTYFEGDVLPHFMDYAYHIRRAMLSQGWVQMLPDRPVVAQPVRADDVALPVVAEAVVIATPKPKPAAVTEAVAPPVAEVEPETEAILKCDSCERTFKDTRGLNVHKAQAHKVSVI